MINIKPEHVETKKIVGRLGTNKVFHILTTGGLHMIIVAKSVPETLGLGSHRCISRHLAQKREPNIVWTDLEKADFIPLEFYQDQLPKYEALTEEFRRAQGL